MHQAGGIQHRVAPAIPQPRAGKPTQLLIRRREQHIAGAHVAALDPTQKLCDLAHRDTPPQGAFLHRAGLSIGLLTPELGNAEGLHPQVNGSAESMSGPGEEVRL
jgi:hypothetical protein